MSDLLLEKNPSVPLQNQMTHKSRASKIPEAHVGHILQHFVHRHEGGCFISTKSLTIELCHAFAVDYANLSLQWLMRQIRWYLAKKKIVSQHVTWIVQNTRYQQAVIYAWPVYVNETILSNKYHASRIVNIDEMNIEL